MIVKKDLNNHNKVINFDRQHKNRRGIEVGGRWLEEKNPIKDAMEIKRKTKTMK